MARRSRESLLRLAAASLLPVSTAFPVVAAILPADPPPRWFGIADVAIALVLVAVGTWIATRRPGPFSADVSRAALRILQGMASLPLVLLVVFFLAGDAVRWHVLLPGLAWRAWLFVVALPSWLALGPVDRGAPRA
jgi:hypothetical protein